MLTTRTLPALLGAAILTLAACGAAAGPSPTPGATPEPTPTAVPGAGSGAGGGGTGGNTGTGVIGGGGIVVPDPNGDPILGQAKFVTPVAGLLDQREASVQLVRAIADPEGVRAEVRWWSGVEPCNALDSIRVDRDETAKSIRLTVIEGSAPGDMACIDIAQLKAAVVDLGQLAAGTWMITAVGDAPAFELEVG
jgi:hypothetical protein